jgi:hypothetical protein
VSELLDRAALVGCGVASFGGGNRSAIYAGSSSTLGDAA